jgi:ribA/ribD-fused uncharacterized protein
MSQPQQTLSDVIRFYSTEDEFGCFSNFSAHPFELDGHTWPTSEHYFQAQKFTSTRYSRLIRLAKTPLTAARMGRSRKNPLRPDWEEVKDDVMRKAVRCKFETHADIRATLLATGDRPLVEQTRRDHYWGCGSTGTGKNMLGLILMEVRAELRRNEAQAESQTV